MNRTVLHYAVVDGDAKAVRAALRTNDVNARDSVGYTALHFAADQNLFAIAQILLKHGAEVEPKDQYGITPLWNAVYSSHGDGSLIKLLLAHGANPDIENDRGETPRDLARKIASVNVLQFLDQPS